MILPSSRSRLATTMRTAASLAIIALSAIVLLYYPPDRYNFYPRCPIFLYLHLQCPGCGSTRALAALLHGHLREALHFNALTTLLLPLVVLYIAPVYPSLWRQNSINWPRPGNGIIYAVLTLTFAFTILRNLPT